MKHIKLLAAITLFITIPAGFYFFIKKRNSKKLVWHQTEMPLRKNLSQYINASGRLQPQDQITVGSLVAGRIIKLHVDDNDFVKQNQVLVQLDDGVGYSAVKKAKAALLEAEANLEYTKAFYERQQALYSTGQLAKDAFEGYTKNYHSANARTLQAQAGLEIAQQNYDNLFIKAPTDGVIIAKKVDLGQMVTSRLQATELFTIAKDLTKMEAEIDVDEADVGMVKQGQDAVFTVDAFPARPFQSKVKQVHYHYRIVDNVVAYAVILDVDNPNLTLRPGMTTNVDIKVASAQNVLCVPNKALRINKTMLAKVAKKIGFTVESIPKTIDSKSKSSLWVLEKKTHFKQVHVKLGISDARFRQVIEGITEADTVVTEALDPSRENPILASSGVRI